MVVAFFGFAVAVEPKTGGRFALLYPDGRTHISGHVLDWSPLRQSDRRETLVRWAGRVSLPRSQR